MARSTNITRDFFTFWALKPASSRLCLTEPNSEDALLDSSVDLVAGPVTVGIVAVAAADTDAAVAGHLVLVCGAAVVVAAIAPEFVVLAAGGCEEEVW